MNQTLSTVHGPNLQQTELVSSTETLALDALRHSGRTSLSTISCKCFDDTVFLSGEVPTYHMKQLAQEVMRQVDGVRRIVNRLDVTRENKC